MIVCSNQARRITELYSQILDYHFSDLDSITLEPINIYYVESVAYEYRLPVILSAMKAILSTKKPNKSKLIDFKSYFAPYFKHYCSKSKIRTLVWDDLSKELYNQLTVNFLNCDFPVNNLNDLVSVTRYPNLGSEDINLIIHSLCKQLPKNSDKRHIPYFVACLKAHLQRKMYESPIKDTESNKRMVSKIQKILAAKLMLKEEDCAKLNNEAEAEEAYRALLNRRSSDDRINKR